MQKVINFPTDDAELNRDIEHARKWPKQYQRNQIHDEVDLLQRLDDIVTFLRITIADSIISGVAIPQETKALLDAILDVQDYLPDRLSYAIILDTTFPEVAAQILNYPK